MATDKLFVYGTLLAGNRARSEFARFFTGASCPAKVRGVLYHLPEGYPTLVLDAGGDAIRGELVELADSEPALRALDEYEGCDPDDPDGGLYRRMRVDVEAGDGPEPAWIYVCPEALQNEARTRGVRIEDGDWRRHLRRGRSPL